MRITPHYKAVGLIAGAALVLAACGTDSNTGSGGDDAAKAANVKCEGKKDLKAAGSTAQKNAMDRFVASYQASCSDANLDYNASGSGDGVKAFIGKQVDFAGSDSPLKDKPDPKKGEKVAETKSAAKTCGSPAWNLPTVFGPVAVAYNVDGVKNLALDASTTAKIFSGKIKKWNDPKIKKLNKGVKLPSTPIKVVYRSDESGTTDNFQKYLEAAAKKDWTKGDGKTFNGGVGEGKDGSDGVSSFTKSTKGAITYVEGSFAQQQKLGTASLINSGGGKPVPLNQQTATKTIEQAKIKGKGNDLVLDLDSVYATKQKNAYPLVLATYEIVCSKNKDPEVAKGIKTFLKVATSTGQEKLGQDGYIPLPASFKSKLTKAIDAIS